MGTKLIPSAFDCYGDAEPNEPVFTLLGRDLHAAKLVRMWARERAEAISRGVYPATDCLKVSEAYECAARMETFRFHRINRLKKAGALSKDHPELADDNWNESGTVITGIPEPIV